MRGSEYDARTGFFFFNATATTELYTLSLHDALPISNVFRLALLENREQRGRDEDRRIGAGSDSDHEGERKVLERRAAVEEQGADRQQRRSRTLRSDRKSTRLNSSHITISYAVFCLKK